MKSRRLIFLLIIALSLLIFIVGKEAVGFFSRVKVANEFSDLSYENAIIRIYLDDYYLMHKKYPDQLDRIIRYEDKDYPLSHYGAFSYTPAQSNTSYMMQLKCSNGNIFEEEFINRLKTKSAWSKRSSDVK